MNHILGSRTVTQLVFDVTFDPGGRYKEVDIPDYCSGDDQNRKM